MVLYSLSSRQGKRGAIHSFQSSWGKNSNAILIVTEVKPWNASHRLMCPQHFAPSLWHCFEGSGTCRKQGLNGNMVEECRPALVPPAKWKAMAVNYHGQSCPAPNCLYLINSSPKSQAQINLPTFELFQSHTLLTGMKTKTFTTGREHCIT